MKQGDTIAIVRDTDRKPSESPNTRKIAAALACGARFATDRAFSDTVESTPVGTRRTVTWLMDAGESMDFAPIATAEKIGMQEFQRRFDSLEWCTENPDHPIAYLRAGFDMHNRLVDKLKTMRPMLLIRKGKRVAIVPSGSDEASKATREQILSEF